MSRSKEASAFSVESALVALESLMKRARPARPISSSRCGRPGKVRRACAMVAAGTPSSDAAPIDGGGVLCIVASAQGGDAGEVGDDTCALWPAICKADSIAVDEIAVCLAPARQRPVRLAGSLPLRCDRSTDVVIDAHERGLGVGNKPLLDGGVVLERAVAIEMIGRDVQQHANRRRQRRRQVDLERRHLDDVNAVRCGRRERQDGSADVAAHLHVAAGGAQNMCDERRGGGLAVGAGDGDDRARGAACGALAKEQLDVADDLDAGRLRLAHRPNVARDASAARRGPERGPRTGRPVGGCQIRESET